MPSASAKRKVRLPHEAAALGFTHLAAAGEVGFLSDPAVKHVSIVENEIVIVELIHHRREIVGGNEPCALRPGSVEVPVRYIERQREQAVRTPFERTSFAFEFDLGAAVAGQHVDHFLIEMPLRSRLSAGRQVDDKDRHEVAAALEVNEGRGDIHARPMPCRCRVQINGEILDDGDVLPARPFQIRIAQEVGRKDFGAVR